MSRLERWSTWVKSAPGVLRKAYANIDSMEMGSPHTPSASRRSERTPSMLVYTVDDVAAHCTGDDCWIIVDDGIYDVTAFVDVHPGGRSALLRMRTPPNARSAMESVGHSKRAYALLDSYRIG